MLNLCYNLPIKSIDFPNVHQVDACLNILSALGIKDIIGDIGINIPSKQTDSALRFLNSIGLQPKNKFAVFNISNNRETSTWQLENFVELGRTIFKKCNYKSIITSVVTDKEKAIKLCDKLKGIGFFYETKKLMDFAAITSMANFLVTGDGGAVHIGASVETPVVALFGGTNPLIYGPYGNKHVVLKSSGGDVKSIVTEAVVNAIGTKGLLE